jgi:glycosyltransferase involved in cell wall biosynthesis
MWSLLPHSLRGSNSIIAFKKTSLGSWLVNFYRHNLSGTANTVNDGSINSEYSLDFCYTTHEISPVKSDLETVLVVIHRADRSGAPMLGLGLIAELKKKFNVVVFLLHGNGPLLEAFKLSGAACVVEGRVYGNSDLSCQVMDIIFEKYKIHFSIINSIESCLHVNHSFLGRDAIPINLIHEFVSCYGNPAEVVSNVCANPGIFVFSANLTLDDATHHFPRLKDRLCYVFPQAVPGVEITGLISDDSTGNISSYPNMLLKLSGETLIVGLGVVHLRKGVDLFIQTAIELFKINPTQNTKFLWVGNGVDKNHNWSYYTFLKDQILRSGLVEKIVMIDEVDNLDPIYEQADILLITSRLDPFPNVAIDAMKRGIPVLCFENTTGISEYLHAESINHHLVSPYLDIRDMAQKIQYLLTHPVEMRSLSQKLKALGREKFKMEDYVGQITHIYSSVKAAKERDLQLLRSNPNLLHKNFYFFRDINELIKESSPEEFYLDTWRYSSVYKRKPIPGFHPGIYKELNKISIEDDPYIHYLKNSKPLGPWQAELVPLEARAQSCLPDNSEVGLHIHVFYMDVLSNIIDALEKNHTRPDLFITTTSHELSEQIKERLTSYLGKVQAIMVHPNKGRDIGPFIGGLGQRLLKDYKFIGHLHTKKSPHAGGQIGRDWMNFLMANLLSINNLKTADLILSYLQENDKVGLVFPDDPTIVSWDKNYADAVELAHRMDIGKLTEHFNFPIGAMFWGRAEALKPLFDLNLGLDDFPKEPLPIDGSMLHAIERLLPFVVTKSGYSYALFNSNIVTR